MIDFATLPPEINSARMYVGPGSAPMVAAASAWNGLAAELRSVALSYGSVLSALTDEEWHGPASAAMASAAMPYVAWMNSTAGQAEQTAAQAQAAATAYEAAFAATVPPTEIAANRTQLTSLVTNNVLGQNTSAIAATEAQYAEMWAQDTTAMYSYATSSAVATDLSQFTGPQQITSAAAQTAQSEAVTQGVATSAGSAQSTLSQLMSAVPSALQGLVTPAASGSGLGGILGGLDIFSSSSGSSAGGVSGLLNLLSGTDGSALGQFMNANVLNTIFSSGFYMPGNFLGSAADFMGMGGQASAATGDAVEGAASGAADAAQGALGSIGGLGNRCRQAWAKEPSSDPCRCRRAGPVLRRQSHCPRHWAPHRWWPLRPRWRQACPGCRWAAIWVPKPRAGACLEYGFRPTFVAHPPAAG